jgi:DNA-binding Xre family transcriptional regulator
MSEPALVTAPAAKAEWRRRRAAISDIERRPPKRIDLTTLERLCTALRRRPEDLITLDKPRRKT